MNRLKLILYLQPEVGDDFVLLRLAISHRLNVINILDFFPLLLDDCLKLAIRILDVRNYFLHMGVRFLYSLNLMRLMNS